MQGVSWGERQVQNFALGGETDALLLSPFCQRHAPILGSKHVLRGQHRVTAMLQNPPEVQFSQL